MSIAIRTTVLSVLLVPAPVIALAQQPAAPQARSETPASAASGVPMGYRSVFEGYRAYSDQPVQPWREANDLVSRIGGWQAYAREGQGGAAPAGSTAASATPAPAKKPAPAKASPAPARASPAPAASTPGAQPSGHSGHRMP